MRLLKVLLMIFDLTTLLYKLMIRTSFSLEP